MNKLKKYIFNEKKMESGIIPKKHDSKDTSLFSRVVTILEEARSNVIRAVNNSMVIAYWLIGREIVQALQGGTERAKYGEKLIEQLSFQLKEKYGRGFSISNLRYFRTFYTVYFSREPEIRQIGSGELVKFSKRQLSSSVLNDISMLVNTSGHIRGFSPNLGWSHYQILMNVKNPNERLFYLAGRNACSLTKTFIMWIWFFIIVFLNVTY